MASSSCSASVSAYPFASSSNNSTIKNTTTQPISSQSRQRIKSPSLAALRQSLLRYRPMRKSSNSSNNSGNANTLGDNTASLMTSCVRPRQNSNEDIPGVFMC